jgi:tetratricopeptide (TPR) repeat protein
MISTVRTLFIGGLLAVLGLAPLTWPSNASAAQASASGLDPEYAALVSQYRQGDFQGAIASLAKWPADRVRAASRAPSRPQGLDIKQAEAIVMLHSDVSMRLATSDQRLFTQHLNSARTWVKALPDDGATGFKERWQAYAIGPYLVQHDLHAALLAVREGVGTFPRSGDLQMMQGTLFELTARGETSDFRGTWTTTGGFNRIGNPVIARIEDGLVAAATSYQRALDLDPSLLPARLRLGWVYDINHSGTHAREQLRMVADRAASRELLYLSHLFLGGIAEEDGHLDTAYDEYDAAHAVQPDAQTAYIALMRTARITGHMDRARGLFAEFPTRSSAGEDPWWYFSMGLDTDLFAWLHAQATQR